MSTTPQAAAMNSPEGLSPYPPVPEQHSIKDTIRCPECNAWLGVERIESGEFNCANCKCRWGPVSAEPESSPTPETRDWAAENVDCYDSDIGAWIVWADPTPFMDRLERERDALKAENGTLREHVGLCHDAIGESRDSDTSELWRFFDGHKALLKRLGSAEAENGRLREALELGREVMRQLSALANVNEATRGILCSTGEKFAKALAGNDAP